MIAEPPDGVSGSMLAAALESAGIPAEVRGGASGWLFPGAAGGLGAVQILVPRSMAVDARAIIDELDAGRCIPAWAGDGRRFLLQTPGTVNEQRRLESAPAGAARRQEGRTWPTRQRQSSRSATS